MTLLRVGEDTKQQELANIAGESANWYNHFRKQFDVTE